jgi:hypothetical protein
VASIRHAPPRIGLFVEGSNYLDPRGRDDLAELWLALCERFGVRRARVTVRGFSKIQIELMNADPRLKSTGHLPLDVLVDRTHRQEPFGVLLVAFDAAPPNDQINGPQCLRTESDFILEQWSHPIAARLRELLA